MCLNLPVLCSRRAAGQRARRACSPLRSVPVADAIYDCSSLYQKNYRISGVYKLPPDDFLGSPELEVRPPPPTAHVPSSVPRPQRDNRASQSLKKQKLKTETNTANTRELSKRSV